VNAIALFIRLHFRFRRKEGNRNKVIDSIKKYGALPLYDNVVPGLFFNKSNAAMNKVYKVAGRQIRN